jgi:hypothetical protein
MRKISLLPKRMIGLAAMVRCRLLLRAGRLKSEICKGRPYTRAVRGPRSKGMGQWQLTIAPQKANSRRKNVQRCFRTALWPTISPRPSMACSLCAPHKPRADGAMVAQELDQLMGTVLEGIYQGNGGHEIPRLLPTAPDTRPWHLRAWLPLGHLGRYAGDRPPSGSGSCQRGRGRGMHRPRSSRPCS